MTSSFESILMSDEVISMVKHMFEPLEITGEAIALDLMDEVGPGGTYLTHEHTRDNYRKSMWFPRFFDRARFDIWKQKGSKDLRQALRDEASRIMAGHSVPALPQEVVERIRRTVESHVPDVEV